ncbi:unnamed protein product [Trypanosoma congolense IL3000]|uniref:Uncharacterized protein TCIL3000_11_13390 n=1 Tax=Trypanosoma congolense (strain IL3000) TaxID=1068625 RepID=F9WBJ5_TRYCI|nr:unnamed protein product [Trypanosoma congolense IL3000]CCD14628.1 unnamed protein product [Trypanosoma congolense IL3000]
MVEPVKDKGAAAGQQDHLNKGGSVGALPISDVRGTSRPFYRRQMSHNTIAELAEGYRVLSNGQKAAAIPMKDVAALMSSVGLHLSEEEFHEVMRVFGRGEQTNTEELSFKDFLALMTCEVDDTMLEEMRSAFLHYDKLRSGYVSRKQFTELFATRGECSSPEELEELLAVAEQDDMDDKIDYNKFINELAHRLNCM